MDPKSWGKNSKGGKWEKREICLRTDEDFDEVFFLSRVANSLYLKYLPPEIWLDPILPDPYSRHQKLLWLLGINVIT
jgi:hypothetical protein